MKPKASNGALIGGLLTAPFIAVSYAGWKVFGLPFVPFDLFDWTASVLPGSVVTFVIEWMVKITAMLNLNTASTAKTAEQMLAIGVVVIAGALAGAVVSAILRVSDEPALLFGVILGAMLSGGALALERSLGRAAPVNSFTGGAWLFATFLAWGLAFGWAFDRVREGGEAATASAGGAPGQPFDRRRFLVRLGGVSAATTLAGTAWGALVGSGGGDITGERWSDGHALPNAGASVTPVPGTRRELTPLERHYRIDTDTRSPVIDEKSWRLTVRGLVERPVEFTLDDLHQYEPMHQFVTLSCISNPVGGDLIGTTRWTGVSVKALLPTVRLTKGATHLRVRSADGFHEVVALDAIERDDRVMLTYAWDGVPLLTEHGFPLRLYIPDVYGMKQPKWIEAIEVVDRWEPGYWVARGWDREGRMKATSAIDVIAVDAAFTDSSRRRIVPVGGIAHAGARGISKVEARVDDDEWHEAKLRDPLSRTAWVIWRCDLPVAEGEHTFKVRCYDGSGAPQMAGELQLHRKRARV